MIKSLGIFLAIIFATLGALHLYWAFAGSGVSENVIPSVNGKAVFHPSAFVTVLVALALFTAMFVILGQIGFLARIIPGRVFYWGTIGISVVFFLRAIGDFRLVGFFKKITDTKFAYWDNWLFSPLCLLISIICLLLLLLKTKENQQ